MKRCVAGAARSTRRSAVAAGYYTLVDGQEAYGILCVVSLAYYYTAAVMGRVVFRENGRTSGGGENV